MFNIIKKLIKEARLALNNSYSPYSKFKVGAAILTPNGKVYTGCNIENVSYGGTVCAERIALFKAVSEGEKFFEKLVIVSEADDYIYPCGICRQIMAEFNLPKIIVTNINDEYREYTLNDLLPKAFNTF